MYPCGAVAGERVRLSKTLVITDHEGNPTGEVHPIGEVWSIIIGIATEPNVVWLREPNGDEHTWDDDTFWEWFKRM